MKNTSLIECYTADTTYLSAEAKMVVLDIITRIDAIDQNGKGKCANLRRQSDGC